MINRVAFIGDTHTGGHCGLMPPDRLPPHLPWTGPRYLWQCWEHMIKNIGQGGLLIVMGDVIEGRNQRGQQAGLHSAVLGDQVEAAIEAYRPLTKRFNRIMRVDGTPYHELYDKAIKWFDEALGVERSSQVLNIRLGDGVLNVAHHPAGGSALYLGTKMDRQTLWASIQTEAGKIPKARWIVRAHLHEFAIFRRKGRTMIQNPCWKLADFHASKLDYERYQPDLGYTELCRDEEDTSGYRVKEYLYDPPLSTLNTEIIDVE